MKKKTYRGRIEFKANSDETGRFSLKGLDPVGRKYLVLAKKEGFQLARVKGVEAGRTDLTVTLSAVGRVDGRVFYGASRAPVPEFHLAVYQITPEKRLGPCKGQHVGGRVDSFVKTPSRISNR